VVEPTHLKNMNVNLGSSSPIFGVNIKKTLKKPPPSLLDYTPGKNNTYILLMKLRNPPSTGILAKFPPQNNGINYQPQLVNAGFLNHQQ